MRLPPGIDVDVSVDVCPWCALAYKDLRTGMTFSEVRNLYWTTSKDSKDWKYKRRNTVLGKWREIKQGMWEEHLVMCACFAEEEPES